MVRCCQSVKDSAFPSPDDIALKSINCLPVQIIKVGMLQGLLGLQTQLAAQTMRCRLDAAETEEGSCTC